MLFTQIEFAVFFAVVMGYLLLVRSHRARNIFLLAASYYFYAYWDWRFLGLLVASTLVDFLAAQGLKRTENPAGRRLLLVASLVCNFTLLGFFKYCNFFIESAAELLGPLGFHPGTLNIILPIGISFYTFQTLSYVIDVYRKNIPTCDNFWDFALFVAFFPQLVAGPILRASDLLPQIASPAAITWERVFEGFRRFTYGLVKKVLIADRLAVFVDASFENAGALDAWTTWLSVLAYSVQIYCDFSGYSDMAIGLGRAMGYDFMENFNHPYLATSITDFWRRWHISLSTWLRDYLYIPLGGNRKGTRRTYINILITMILGGLWHGAAWTFVAWGTLHGVALAAHKWLAPHLEIPEERRVLRAAQKALGWIVTLLIVNVAWVLFRSQTFGQALLVLRQMFCGFGGAAWYYPFAIGAVLFTVATHGIHATRFAQLPSLRREKWYTPVILFALLWAVFIFHPRGFTPFIYFQF